MNYYHLLKYETRSGGAARRLRGRCTTTGTSSGPSATRSSTSWPPRASTAPRSPTAFGTEALTLPAEDWRDDTLDTLRRFPVDLVDHGLANSHRLDLRAARRARAARRRGAPRRFARRDGKVLPVDERMVFHWNLDPYALDYAGTGTRLADGTSFLLPYYMALYHKVIVTPAAP